MSQQMSALLGQIYENASKVDLEHLQSYWNELLAQRREIDDESLGQHDIPLIFAAQGEHRDR